MPPSPSDLLSRLTLDSPSPASQSSHSKMASQSLGRSRDSDDDDSDSDSDESPVEQSPTGLSYNISRLSEDDQQMVRDLFQQTKTQRRFMLFDYCRIFRLPPVAMAEDAQEADDRYYYAFGVQEVKPFTVRIKSHDDKSATIYCPCRVSEDDESDSEDETSSELGSEETGPCPHVICLLDHIAKHTYDFDQSTELHLTKGGRIAELGSAFKRVSDLRLSIFADDLRCDMQDDHATRLPPSPRRIKEAKDMTAILAGIDPRQYKKKPEEDYDRSTLIYRGDLERTLFSLLLSSSYLFELVRAELDKTEPPNHPFYALEGRALQVVEELNLYAASLRNEVARAALSRAGKQWEPPRDVSWAAKQIEKVVREIHNLVERNMQAGGLEGRKMADLATRTLIRVLHAVVNHNYDSHAGATLEKRNLYQRLIGGRNSGFICNTLELLVEQRDWAEQLSSVVERCAENGCPEPWLTKMRKTAQHMKSGHRSDVPQEPGYLPEVGTPAGSSAGFHQGFGRVFSMPPTPTTTSQGSSPSTSTAGPGSARDPFVRPEVPASASATARASGRSGRGDRGESSQGAGSKRSGPSGTSRGYKRAR